VLGLRGYRRSYTLRGESDRAHALGEPAALEWAPSASADPSRSLCRLLPQVSAAACRDGVGLDRGAARVAGMTLGPSRSRAAVGTRTLEFALAAMGVMGD
jgi:hypothetical protein